MFSTFELAHHLRQTGCASDGFLQLAAFCFSGAVSLAIVSRELFLELLLLGSCFFSYCFACFGVLPGATLVAGGGLSSGGEAMGSEDLAIGGAVQSPVADGFRYVAADDGG